MLTSHPIGTRYHGSRRKARADRRQGERVVSLGVFSDGSFGVYARRKSGQPIGGHPALVRVWAIMPM